MRDDFTISNVCQGVNWTKGVTASSIQFTLRMDSNEYVVRLIPGFDPYATFMVINQTELAFYRFDKRTRAMSDLAELHGIDQAFWTRAINQLLLNPTAKQTGIVFLGLITNRIDYPRSIVYALSRNICGFKDPIMQISKSAGHGACLLSLPPAIKAIIDKHGCRIECLSKVFMKQIKSDIAKQYGDMRVMFNELMYKRRIVK